MTDHSDNPVRNRIINKCSEIFAYSGFSKISMDEVSSSLGMSKKTLYKYFSNKEELVKTVILEFRDSTLSHIEAVLQDTDIDNYQRLVRVLDITGKQLSRIRKPILEDLRKYMPEFWTEIEERRRVILTQVYEGIISDGKKEGVFREDTDVEFFILMYMSLVTSIVNPDVLSKIPYNPSQVFQKIVNTLFTGILTDEARTRYQSKFLS